MQGYRVYPGGMGPAESSEGVTPTRPPSRPEQRSGRSAQPKTLRADLLTTVPELRRIATKWQALYAESGATTPFLQPAWAITWASHFVRPGQLRAVAVWSGDKLVALAPFYRSTV